MNPSPGTLAETAAPNNKHWSSSLWKGLGRHFFSPVDNSPLVLFRILFGLLIFLETAGAIATGWVKETFVDPTVHFPFIGFEWLQPLPGYGMYGYYALMAVCGLLVMVGLYYRIAILGFTCLWWGSYLMQKFNYNNHYYLLVLLCGIMVWMPAHRYASLDVRRNPAIRQLTCPKGVYWIFITQLAIVYTYAALAKLYPDWLSLKPINLWFGYKSDYPVVGPWLQKDWVKAGVAYGGIAFDLLIVPLLLWSRTRWIAFSVSLFFHLFNAAIFQIGIFPFLMIGMSVFFFPPDGVRRFFLRKKPAPETEIAKGASQVQVLSARQTGILITLGIYFLFQVVLPLRHWWFPGNVNWTEEGHRMSWRMMLRSKSGTIYFTLKDLQSGQQWQVFPSEYLTSEQTGALATHPDMIWQFVQHLKTAYGQKGIRNVQVFARCEASLNGRPYQLLIDPSVDLAALDWQPFRHASWILPLNE